MSHLSPHGDQGYPGNLLVRITFELSYKNEFHMDMEAFTTVPTIVNLSNLIYFNLAGHHQGPDQVKLHIVSINGNCYTVNGDDGFPTGEIINVAHSRFDIQTPTSLGKKMVTEGYDQNICVNKGVHQDDTYVGRLIHNPSGRILEVYSNQYGVQFSTANNLGHGYRISVEDLPKLTQELGRPAEAKEHEDISLRIIDYLHAKMLQELREEEETYYAGFREFINILQKLSYKNLDPKNAVSLVSTETGRLRSSLKQASTGRPSKVSIVARGSIPSGDDLQYFTCNPKQMTYLETLHSVLKAECFGESGDWLTEVIQRLIFYATINAEKAAAKAASTNKRVSVESNVSSKLEDMTRIPSTFEVKNKSDLAIEKPIIEKPVDAADLSEEAPERASEVKEGPSGNNEVPSKVVLMEEKKPSKPANVLFPTKFPNVPPSRNVIPPYYKSCDQIVGKGRKVYKTNGGITLQTQNYPGCEKFSSFPNCVLNPGETYRHTITYKFWIRRGNPKRWKKRNKMETENVFLRKMSGKQT